MNSEPGACESSFHLSHDPSFFAFICFQIGSLASPGLALDLEPAICFPSSWDTGVYHHAYLKINSY
jgi:hypothetical protein